MGKIGNKEIVRESIQSFMQNTKGQEWTSNTIYKGATNSEVKPIFSMNKKNDNTLTKFKDNVIDNYLVKDNKVLEEYFDVVQDIENKNMKVFDKIEMNKQKICNISGFNQSTIKEEIIGNLNNNWKKTVINNEELHNLLMPYRN